MQCSLRQMDFSVQALIAADRFFCLGADYSRWIFVSMERRRALAKPLPLTQKSICCTIPEAEKSSCADIKTAGSRGIFLQRISFRLPGILKKYFRLCGWTLQGASGLTPALAKPALTCSCVCLRLRVLLICELAADSMFCPHCNKLHTDKILDSNCTDGNIFSVLSDGRFSLLLCYTREL